MKRTQVFKTKSLFALSAVVCAVGILSHFYSLPVANATFMDSQDATSGPGRPRFGRRDYSKKYLIIGVGFVPFDRIESVGGLGFNDAQTKIITSTGPVLSYDVTGLGLFGFGFSPSLAPWLRFNIEIALKGAPMTINGTVNIAPDTTTAQNFNNLQVLTISLRAIVEIYFQLVLPKKPVAFFAGAGLGLIYQGNVFRGSPVTSNGGIGTQVVATTGATQEIYKSLTNFAPVFTFSGGMTIDVTQGFSAELKLRYAMGMFPFGSHRFSIFENSIEILVSLLLKL